MDNQTQQKPQNQETALAVQQPGGALAEPQEINYAEDEGEGSTIGRDIDINKIIIPRLIILQAENPLCKKVSPEYIEGLSDGNFYNLQTKEQFDGKAGIHLIISEYYSDYEERSIPEKEGDQGKLIAIHPQKSDIVRASSWQNKHFLSPDGNPMIERFNIFGLLLQNGDTKKFSRVCFRLRVTHKTIKNVISDLMTAISNWYEVIDGKNLHMPCFAGIYRLILRPETNEKNSWWVPVLFSEQINGEYVCHKKYSDKNLYENARAFRKLVQAGEVVTEEAPVEKGSAGKVNLDGVPF